MAEQRFVMKLSRANAQHLVNAAALITTQLVKRPSRKRWILQNVHSGGAAAIAGIEPGNILLRVDGLEIVPPEHPVFPMGKQTNIKIIPNDCGE